MHLLGSKIGVQIIIRYYDPVAGRFLSTDPVLTDINTAASFNKYTYALNNPYKYIDPDGRQSRNLDEPYKAPHTEVTKVLKTIVSAIKENVAPVPVSGSGANKTQINAGPIEVSHTVKEDKSSSTFVGIRAPSLAIQNVTEAQAKIGDISGLTVKASTAAGMGKFGVSTSLAVSTGDGTHSGGVQASVGMARSSSNFVFGIVAPGPAIGWTFKHDAPVQP